MLEKHAARTVHEPKRVFPNIAKQQPQIATIPPANNI